MSEQLKSKQAKWITIRDTIAHDGLDTTLGVTGRKWDDVPTHDTNLDTIKIPKIPQWLNEVRFRFRATGSISQVTWKLWFYQQEDDAEYVANGTADFGTQTSTMTNGTTATLYADKIIITAQRFRSSFTTTHPSGNNNEMAQLYGDAKGAFLPYMELTAVSGTGSISVDYNGV